MIVVAIIGLLAAIAIPSFLKARERSRHNRAESDLRALAQAIDMLHMDTGLWPLGRTAGEAQGGGGNECEDLRAGNAGVISNDSTFWNWNGPYLKKVPRDPWKGEYFFDEDYDINGQTKAVVGSYGPNGVGLNLYDADDIIVVLEQLD